MRGHCVFTFVGLVLLLLMRNGGALQNGLRIEVKYNGTHNNSYTDESWFSNHYANVPSRVTGHLGQPNPRNACLYVEPLLEFNESWFALVYDYPSCPHDMIINIRNAGYKLIITSSNHDRHRGVSKSLRNTDFPVVVVRDSFAEYLRDYAVSNSSGNPFTLHITVSNILPIIVITCSSFVLLVCCYVICCVCCVCCVFRREEDVERRLQQIENRRREFERHQRHERLARQELIQSILRQLQELQLDIRHQVPLGRAETEQLPKRGYQVGKDICDTCAICVEDLTQGEMVRVLPCDHVFHPRCIDEWLINHSSLCPLCKMELPRKQDQNIPNPVHDVHSDSDTSTSSTDSLLQPRNRTGERGILRPIYGSV